jgi:hypothetical protein
MQLSDDEFHDTKEEEEEVEEVIEDVTTGVTAASSTINFNSTSSNGDMKNVMLNSVATFESAKEDILLSDLDLDEDDKDADADDKKSVEGGGDTST